MPSDNVVQLGKRRRQLVIVEQLEQALARARAGEVDGVLLALALADGRQMRAASGAFVECPEAGVEAALGLAARITGG